MLRILNVVFSNIPHSIYNINIIIEWNARVTKFVILAKKG